MRMRLVARTAAGLLLAGSLAACFPAEETPALLTAQPNPLLIDLPAIGGDGARVQHDVVLRNLGPGAIPMGGLSITFTGDLDEEEPGFLFLDATSDCDGSLEINETCTVNFDAFGTELALPNDIVMHVTPVHGLPVNVPIRVV